jgi:hypothetical protein
MAAHIPGHEDDLVPVHGRISWGALGAGAMVALAFYFLLTLLGSSIGLSVSDQVRAESFGTGAALWGIASTLLSLFGGGYVTSQCTVGGHRGEAVLYGLILWSVVYWMLLWLTGIGLRSSFPAMVGLANTGETVGRHTTVEDWEVAAKRAGVTPEVARRVLEDPQHQQAMIRITWWAFLGTLLSMLASVAGTHVGAGRGLRSPPSSAPESTNART